MSTDELLKLPFLSFQTSVDPIIPQQTVLCSPHDLIAIVTQAHDVVVYRLNGQIAFTIKNPSPADEYLEDDGTDAAVRVTCVHWSPDGRRIAVAWSDGTWSVREGERGGLVLEDSVRNGMKEGEEQVVVGFDWRRHTRSSEKRDHTVLSAGEEVEGYHDQQEDLDDVLQKTRAPDLPRSVTMLDPTVVMPRLSALPSHGVRAGAEGTRFANQAATDDVFASPGPGAQDGSVEILLVYSSDGTIRVVLDGTSLVGTISALETEKVIWCRPRSTSSSCTFITSSPTSGLQLNFLDFPLEQLGGAMLHKLSHASSQLSSLLAYIQRTKVCISHDFSTGIAYPTRLTNNISMTLEDDVDSRATLSSALIHLAMTGEYHPAVLDWLADIVKDTGLKRWDTSVSGMYSAIQSHIHMHILPALDRLSITSSGIRGLARLHQGTDAFEPNEQLFSDILDAIDGLRLLSLEMLKVCTREWTLWRGFAKWLKMEIEIAAAGPGSKGAAESEERDGIAIDYSSVLSYIRQVMQSGSRLKSFIEGKNSMTIEQCNLATVREMMEKMQEDSKQSFDFNLAMGVTWLETTVQTALDRVRKWQGRMFTTPKHVQLELIDFEEVTECWPILETTTLGGNELAILTVSTEQDGACKVHRASNVNAIHEQLKEGTQRHMTLDVHNSQEDVVGARMCDDGKSLLLLRQTAGTGQVLDLVKVSLDGKSTTNLHQFSTAEQFVPTELVVGGRVGREFCVVFGRGNRSWQVLDMRGSDGRADSRLRDETSDDRDVEMQ